ncbi:MAG: serine/threonine-protein kinase [Pirellulales bacterium]
MTEEDLFESLVKAPLEARNWLLEQKCGSDAVLRERLRLLLEAHDRSNLLDDPLPTVEMEAAAGQLRGEQTGCLPSTDSPLPEKPGVKIGPYILEQRLGEGGMGAVWVASQNEPVKRRVALKLIKAGMDSREILSRFEHERQALALMEHPNIAKVLDAGITAEGRPYFAMELVNGLPLTRFCDEARLTTEQRLEVFTQVCSAVQHAHQKGIIHRDLKPANILVTLIDGKPAPKVIDFGVSKAISNNVLGRTTMTNFGAVVGTLDYMAPEQAGYSGADVDTRADIYALGVILYELLTGLKPFDPQRLCKAALDEVIRIIREEEPSKPSTRISSAESRPSLAAARGEEPSRLARKIRGDLDWIALKCLEKDRNRRYETANQLAMEIKRYLADEPVLAGPPTASYLLRKFLKRNRRQVAVAGVVLAALIGGLFASLWQMNRAIVAEHSASLSRDAEVAQRIKAEANAIRALEGSRQTREALEAVTDDVVRTLFVRATRLTEDERRFFNRLLAMYDRLAEFDGDDTDAASRRMTGYWRVTEIQTRLGAYEDATVVFERMADSQAEIADRHPENPSHRLAHVAMLRGAFNMLKFAGRNDNAEEFLKRAEDSLRLASVSHPENLDVRELEITLAHDRALLIELGSPEREATFRKLAREAEELLQTAPERSGVLAVTLSCLREQLNELSAQERYEEVLENGAEQLELLKADRPAVARQGVDFILSQQANTHRELGRALASLGRTEEAIIAYNRGLEFARQRRDAGLARAFQWDIVWDQLRMLHTGLAALHESQKQWKESAAGYREALAATERWAEFVHDQRPIILTKDDLQRDLARVLQLGGAREEAIVALLACAEFREKHLDQFDKPRDYRSSVPGCCDQAAQILSELGRWEESLVQRKRAIALYQALLAETPDEPPFSLRIRNQLGWAQIALSSALFSRQEVASGLEVMEQAIAAFQEQLVGVADDEESRKLKRVASHGIATAHHKLADYWWGKGELAKARDCYSHAIPWKTKYFEEDPADTVALESLAWGWHNRGRIHSEMGDFLPGSADFGRAIQLAMSGPPSNSRLAEIIDVSIHRLDTSAELRRTARKPEEALSVFREVLGFRQQMAQRATKYLLHITWSHHNICVAALDAGQVEEALRAAEELQAACAVLGKQPSDDGEMEMNATNTAFKAGKRLLDAGHTAAARDLYATRLAMRLELARRFPEQPGFLDAVMYAQFDMFLAYWTEGNRDAALTSMRQAIDAVVARKNKFPASRESYEVHDRCVNSICAKLREDQEFALILQVVRDYLAQTKDARPDDLPLRSSILAFGGRAALAVKEYAEAESILRESMKAFDATIPNDWQAYNIRCYVGEALLGQDKLAEAETLLTKGYEGMFARRASIPPGNTVRLRAAVELLKRSAEKRNSTTDVDKWNRELERLEGKASSKTTQSSNAASTP